MSASVLNALQVTCERFLDYAGYAASKPGRIGFSKPDVRGHRVTVGKTWDLILVIVEDVEQLLDGLEDLMAIKCVLGNQCEYAAVLPPVSEYKLIEFFTGEEDWHGELKKQNFMLWLVNPERESVCCLMGAPADKTLQNYFIPYPAAVSFDAYIARKNIRWLDEEE